METADYIAESIARAWKDPFRGSIYEYARGLDLQAGYSVKGSFDINTCRHLIGPLDAIRDPDISLVSIKGAVQTLKSLLLDITVPYWIENDPGDTLWLFEDDAKAKLYAETRAMPMIRGKPEIARMLEDVDRHDKTRTKLKFKHMNLVFAGLNEGNVQSISYRYVIVDELWMAKSNGLVRHAKDRTKQYPHTKKIILLGQGGIEDDDADLEHKETDMRELQYRCPHCSHAQPYALVRERPENAKIKPEIRFAGLSWETNEITRPNGRWNYAEVARTAHHVCFNCASRIIDTPEVRRKLNDSHHYKVTNPLAPRGLAGFWWPGEASMRVPLGDLVVKYLRARVFYDELAYKLPLREFHQKDRGVSWSEMTGGESKPIVYEAYDVKSDWAEEAYRPMIVDCQRDLKKFYAQVFAVSLAGESRELARRTLDSWQEVAKLQTEWKVKDQFVFVDCGYQMTEVLRECVKHGHVATLKVGARSTKKIWRCWNGLKGSGLELFKHIHPRTGAEEFRIYSARKFYDTNIGTNQRSPRSPWYEWSNLHCKDLLKARRDGAPNAPKFLILPETAAPTDIWSYHAQMRSEHRHEDYNGGRKRAIYLPVKKTRPNHWWDTGAMLMAFMAIVGIIGAPEEAPADEGAEATG